VVLAKTSLTRSRGKRVHTRNGFTRKGHLSVMSFTTMKRVKSSREVAGQKLRSSCLLAFAQANAIGCELPETLAGSGEVRKPSAADAGAKDLRDFTPTCVPTALPPLPPAQVSTLRRKTPRLWPWNERGERA
jgi:hypothetical protein